MSIPLTGAGSLFVRLGHDGGAFYDVNALAGGTATARVLSGASFVTRTATLEADYAAGTPAYQVIDGFATAFANVTGTGGCQGLLAQILPTFQTLAQATVISMANTDVPLPTPDLPSAMTLLIKQMYAAATGVAASVVAAGAFAALVPSKTVGNPVIVASVKNGQGLTCEYTIPETVLFVCTADSISGGATAKQEAFSILGQNAQTNELLYNWGTSAFGSGGSIAGYTLCDAAQNNAGGNLLQNAEFVTATTANNPDNWTIAVGTAGTNVFQAGSGYLDNSSLQFTGDGVTFMSVTQLFNTTPSTVVGGGGTAGTLSADTQYAVNFWLKATAPTASSTIICDLIDGSSTVINDDQAVANSFTTTLNTLFAGALTISTPGATNTTPIAITSTAHGLQTGQQVVIASVGGNTAANGTWNIVVTDANTFTLVGSAGNGNWTSGGTATLNWGYVNGAFRTPANLPSTVKLRIRLGGTVSANAKVTLIDRVGMTPMQTLYQGGPSFAMFSANANPVSGGSQPDQFTVGITNTFGAWQQFFEQMFGMRALGLQLPSGQTTTISASLIA